MLLNACSCHKCFFFFKYADTHRWVYVYNIRTDGFTWTLCVCLCTLCVCVRVCVCMCSLCLGGWRMRVWLHYMVLGIARRIIGVGDASWFRFRRYWGMRRTNTKNVSVKHKLSEARNTTRTETRGLVRVDGKTIITFAAHGCALLCTGSTNFG